MARGEDTSGHPSRKVGRDTFAPPSPGTAAAPLSRHDNMSIKLAQNDSESSNYTRRDHTYGTARIGGPVSVNAYNEEKAGLPPSPPSGWPTVQEVEDNGVNAFDKAAKMLVTPKPGYNDAAAMHRLSVNEKETIEFKKNKAIGRKIGEDRIKTFKPPKGKV